MQVVLMWKTDNKQQCKQNANHGKQRQAALTNICKCLNNCKVGS